MVKGHGSDNEQSAEASAGRESFDSKAQEERVKNQLLPSFDIKNPSNNKEINTNTFAYRLSELVFGSLLASYILGFLGFVVTYVQPLQKDAANDSSYFFTLTVFLKVTSYVDVIILMQYLTNSLLFSFFTALVYFHYHQSILYIKTDLQRSTADFKMAMLIGISFGLSMLLPMMGMFFSGLLIVAVMSRKKNLVNPYLDHFAAEVKLQYEGNVAEHRKKIRAALKSNVGESKPNPVLESWSAEGKVAWWGGICMMVATLIVYVFVNLIPYTSPFLKKQLADGYIPTLNLVVTIVIAVLIFYDLKRTNSKMPVSNKAGDLAVDAALNEALLELKRNLDKTNAH